MSRRTGSWKVKILAEGDRHSSPEESGNGYDVILVHGLKGQDGRLSAVRQIDDMLRMVVADSLGRSSSVRTFSVSGYDTILTGPPRLQDNARGLLDEMKRIQSKNKALGRKQKFIFVAYHLGTYNVKNALSQPESIVTFADQICGVLFLDIFGNIFDHVEEQNMKVTKPLSQVRSNDSGVWNEDTRSKWDKEMDRIEVNFGHATGSPFINAGGIFTVSLGPDRHREPPPQLGADMSTRRKLRLLAGLSRRKSGELHLNDVETLRAELSKRLHEIKMSPYPPPRQEKSQATRDEATRLADIGEAFLKGDGIQRALEFFESSLKLLDGDTLPGQYLRTKIKVKKGITLLLLGRYTDAKDVFEELLNSLKSASVGPELSRDDWEDAMVQVRWSLAECIFRQGIYEDALKALGELTHFMRSISPKRNPEFLQYDIGAYGLQALCLAYLGHYDKAGDDLEAIQHRLGSNRRYSEALRYISHFYIAKFYLLSGNYSEGLVEIEKASKGLDEIWRDNHITRLETGILHSLLLALTGRTKQAQENCAKVADRIHSLFGTKHPLALDAADVLVNISCRQAIYFAARQKSIEISKAAEDTLGKQHPLTLRARSRYASICMLLGDYRDSTQILQGVVGDSTRWESRPDVLRCKAELALSKYHWGDVDAAKAEILVVINSQESILYSEKEYQGTSANNAADADTVVTRLVERIDSNTHPKRMHPDLLFSLQVFARILMTEPASDVEDGSTASRTFRLKLFEAIRQRLRVDMGDNHYLTLQADYQYAIALGEYRGARGMGMAKDLLDLVFSARCQALGASHPDTLRTEREFIVASASLGDATRAEERLQGVYERQERCLGRPHQETMKTLLSLVAVHRALKNPAANGLSDQLFDGLRDEQAKRQRPMATIKLEQKFAVLCYQFRCLALCVSILDDIYTSLQRLASEAEQHELEKRLPIQDLIKEVDNNRQQTRPFAQKEFETHRDECIHRLENNRTVEGIESYHKAAPLAVALFGERDLEIVATFKDKAATLLWETGDEGDRDLAFRIMEPVVSSLESSEEVPNAYVKFAEVIVDRQKDWRQYVFVEASGLAKAKDSAAAGRGGSELSPEDIKGKGPALWEAMNHDIIDSTESGPSDFMKAPVAGTLER